MVENMVVQVSACTPASGSASGLVSDGTGQEGLPLANFADSLQAVVAGLNKASENSPGGNFDFALSKTFSLDEIMQKLFGGGEAGNGSGTNKKTASKGDMTDELQQMMSQVQASVAQPVIFTGLGQSVNSATINSEGMSLAAVNAATPSPAIAGQNTANTAGQNISHLISNITNAATPNSVILTKSTARMAAQNTVTSLPGTEITATTANTSTASVDNTVNASIAASAITQSTANTATTAVDNTVSLSQSAGDTAIDNIVNVSSVERQASRVATAITQSTANTAAQNTVNPAQNAADTAAQNTVNPAQNTADTAAQNTVNPAQNTADTAAQNTVNPAQNAADTAAQNTVNTAQNTADTASQSSGNMGLNAFAEDMNNDLNISEVNVSAANENKPGPDDASDSAVAATAGIHQTTYSKASEPVQENVPVSRLNELSAPILDTLESGGRHLVIKLSPPDMGTIEIKLKMENGILTADFKVDSTAVKDLFTVAMPNIKQSIEGSGIKTGNFFADLKEDSNTSGGKQQNSNQQQQKQQKEQGSSFFDFFA